MRRKKLFGRIIKKGEIKIFVIEIFVFVIIIKEDFFVYSMKIVMKVGDQ